MNIIIVVIPILMFSCKFTSQFSSTKQNFENPVNQIFTKADKNSYIGNYKPYYNISILNDHVLQNRLKLQYVYASLVGAEDSRAVLHHKLKRRANYEPLESNAGQGEYVLEAT